MHRPRSTVYRISPTFLLFNCICGGKGFTWAIVFVFQVFSFSSVKQDLLANARREASGSHYAFSVANSVNIKCSYNLVVYFKFFFTLRAFITHYVISWKLPSPKQYTEMTNCKMKNSFFRYFLLVSCYGIAVLRSLKSYFKNFIAFIW